MPALPGRERTILPVEACEKVSAPFPDYFVTLPSVPFVYNPARNVPIAHRHAGRWFPTARAPACFPVLRPYDSTVRLSVVLLLFVGSLFTALRRSRGRFIAQGASRSSGDAFAQGGVFRLP
jgi:hypothetical protein